MMARTRRGEIDAAFPARANMLSCVSLKRRDPHRSSRRLRATTLADIPANLAKRAAIPADTSLMKPPILLDMTKPSKSKEFEHLGQVLRRVLADLMPQPNRNPTAAVIGPSKASSDSRCPTKGQVLVASGGKAQGTCDEGKGAARPCRGAERAAAERGAGSAARIREAKSAREIGDVGSPYDAGQGASRLHPAQGLAPAHLPASTILTACSNFARQSRFRIST